VKNKFSVFLLILLLSCFAAGGVVLFLLNERELPAVDVQTDVEYIGLHKEINLLFSDQKSGIRSFGVYLEQGGKQVPLLTESFPRAGYFRHAGPNSLSRTVEVDTASLGLKDGRADLVIKVRDFSFWNYLKGNELTDTRPVMLDTVKPRVRILDSPRYIKAGGSSIVIYEINEPVASHGAVINGHFYGGFPVSAKNAQLFGAMLGLEYTTHKISEMMVTATDRAGNVGEMPFRMILKPMLPKRDRITVSDAFLESKMPEFSHYYPDLPGTNSLEKYLYVNNEMRQQNNEKIREITSTVTPERLWDGVFERLPRSSTRAGFADERTYYYQGRKVDHQVHLGIDLASVSRAPALAANRGRVVFADNHGIYGNMVIIDHGWGLFSLYSHLSQISVQVDDMVEKGKEIGLTGATGMAGGDHLHFSILVDGIFVNPLEWWDEHWLKLNILNYI
jgi:murein DD-endopeptidase MepM/ murein hydrolase activator NlpD